MIGLLIIGFLKAFVPSIKCISNQSRLIPGSRYLIVPCRRAWFTVNGFKAFVCKYSDGGCLILSIVVNCSAPSNQIELEMQMYAAQSQSNALLSPFLSLERSESMIHSHNGDGFTFEKKKNVNVEQSGNNNYTIRPD